jgi:2'-phosphotransferase
MQLARPKMKTVDEPTVFRLVNDNAKKRFELVYGMDPSPPKPKKQKAPKKKAPQRPPPGSETVDALGAQIASASIADTPVAVAAPAPPAVPEWKELEFVTLPAPTEAEEGKGQWFIRASQGHTLKVETSHLEPVTDTEEGRLRAGLMVHGTQWKLWDTLSELKRPL